MTKQELQRPARFLLRLAALALAAATLVPLQAQIGPDDLLPVEEAFAIDWAQEGDELVVGWDIAEGYYMYRHAFEFEAASEGLELDDAAIPPGEQIVDEFFGETETYRDRVEIRIPVKAAPAGGDLTVNVRSQGCADLGVCYPPHREQIELVWADTAPAGSARDIASTTPASQGGLGDLFSGAPEGLVPAEEAFSFEAFAVDAGRILVRVVALPDYYLYREQFAFRLADDEIDIVQALLPAGEAKVDEFFGETEVYFGEVEIPLELTRPAGSAQAVTLEVDYQGCWEGGVCFPPLTHGMTVDLPPSDVGVRVDGTPTDDPADEPAPEVAMAEQDRLAAALAGRPALALTLFLIAGLLLAFTPCVFPMVPILSGLIAGEGDRMTTGRAFRLSLVYVLAMALVYTAFGVVAGLFGQNLQAVFQHPAVLSSFAGLFVLLSLAMFGFYDLQLPASWQTRLNEWSNRAEGGTLMGAAIMGALSALIVGPCVAPALMGALIYIGQTGDAMLGGAALFAMAMGMGIPLVIWGTSAGRLLPRAGAWMNAVKAVFGVGLLALAVWMLERVVPPAVTMMLWGMLAIASGIYLGALTRLDDSASGWKKLWQSLGVIMLVLGILQLIGAASGGRDWTRPLGHLAGGGGAVPAAEVSFRHVETLDELQGAIASSTRPVFVDFYADWCVDCVRMERRTFPDPEVARRMADFTLLKVDVTDYTSNHQEILSHFGLIGPPAYLFFVDGEELQQHRTFGFLNPNRFSSLLDEVSS
ncbi:protein-disulfide reductase DsbD [Wenzhouxiangella sp. AB-CW3]|uniref:protein-disulfide reductase DsbD n=1 Tax=Wenzhouxiangella sp. AB-CW3 TaxID=2771012 RepID=UPI00168B42E2|nr:protein-disulfide reductase DsbD [Wenzhouxiangella sp. AB-CW3]QOC22957.1 protein-disulfide reductase DsbD [Wenzhouxiangella sp. AB-CW3]